MTRMKKTCLAISLTLIYAVFALAAIFLLSPWNLVIAHLIKEKIESFGLSQVNLSVKAINLRHIELQNLRFGADNTPLEISRLIANYSLDDLKSMRVQDIEVEGATLTLRQTQSGWTLDGLPESNSNEEQASTLPVTKEFLENLPFSRISLRDSILKIDALNGTLTLPLNITFQTGNQPALTLEPTTIKAHSGGLRLTGTPQAQMTFDAGKEAWSGAWEVENLEIIQSGDPLPKAEISGTLTADKQKLIIRGKAKCENKICQGGFTYNYTFAEPQKASLVMDDFSMPWHEGTVSTAKVIVPLAGGQDYRFTLSIHKASIATLMQDITGENVKATGTISGKIPVTIKPDGTFSIGKGSLMADGPGILSMPGQVIPGEGQQMELTRDILEKFNYNLLSLTTDKDKNGRFFILAALEGNNPKVQDGRAVKLNIKLSGDVLDFISSSVIVFTNPQALLNKERP